MTSRVVVAVTAVLAVGAIAGCGQTVTGTVAMTTQPGADLSTRSSPQRTPGSRSPNPRIPTTAPGNARSMTCGEYATLTPDQQTAIASEIFGVPDEANGGMDLGMLSQLLTVFCQMASPSTYLTDAAGSPP